MMFCPLLSLHTSHPCCHPTSLVSSPSPSSLYTLPSPSPSPPSPLPSTHHDGANRRTPWPLASNAIFTTQILSLLLDFPFLCWLLSNLYFWATCEGCRRDWEEYREDYCKKLFCFL